METKIRHTEAKQSKSQFLRVLTKIIQPDTPNLLPVSNIQEKAVVSEKTADISRVKSAGVFRKDSTVVFFPSVKKEIEANVHFTYSAIDTIESARSGIKFSDFKNVYDLIEFSNSKWAEIIGISERTMQNIIKEKRDLDQNKSEKLLAFLTLVEYALDVLGNEKNFEEWLNYKSPALKGKAPIEYVDTFQGISMLREQLFKIETGNLI